MHAFKYKLNPNKEQLVWLNQTAGSNIHFWGLLGTPIELSTGGTPGIACGEPIEAELDLSCGSLNQEATGF